MSATSPATGTIDTRGTRAAQAVTGTLLLTGVALREPAFVYAVALVLGVAVLSGWRLDLYELAWRHAVRPVVGEPGEDYTSNVSPKRFAKLLVALGTTLASVLFLTTPTILGYELAFLGYVLAGAHGAFALLAALGNYCVACVMYQQFSFVRRIGVV